MRHPISILSCLSFLGCYVGVLTGNEPVFEADDLPGCVLLQTQITLRATPLNRTTEISLPARQTARNPRNVSNHAGLLEIPTIWHGYLPADLWAKLSKAHARQGHFVDRAILNEDVGFVSMCLAIVAVGALIFLLSAPETTSGQQLTDVPEAVAAATVADAKTIVEEHVEKPMIAGANPKQAQSGIILTLDGMRFLLIMNVICNHAGVRRLPLFESMWLQHSSMIFFTTLSGFVRYMSLKKRDTCDLKTWRAYASNVLARFFPGNSMALVLTFLLAVHWGRYPLLAWPVQALFLSSVLEACPTTSSQDSQFYLAGNYVGWFTSAIVIGALLLPLFYNLRPKQNPLHIMVALVCVICLRDYADYLINPMHGASRLLPTIGSDSFFAVRFLEMLAGALTAQLATAVPLSFLQWQGWGWVFDGAIVAFLALKEYAVRQQSLIGLTSGAGTDKVFPHWTIYCTLVLMPILIFSAFAATQKPNRDGWPSSGLLGRFLACWPLTSMAKYSFGAYIYQSPARSLWKLFAVQVLYIQEGQADARGPVATTLLEWAPVVVSLFIAVASEHLLEKHIRNIVQKRVRGGVA